VRPLGHKRSERSGKGCSRGHWKVKTGLRANFNLGKRANVGLSNHCVPTSAGKKLKGWKVVFRKCGGSHRRSWERNQKRPGSGVGKGHRLGKPRSGRWTKGKRKIHFRNTIDKGRDGERKAGGGQEVDVTSVYHGLIRDTARYRCEGRVLYTFLERGETGPGRGGGKNHGKRKEDAEGATRRSNSH